MTTSATTTWELTRDEIISATLRKLGVLAEGQTASTEQITYGAQALNSLITLFQTKGMPLWKRTVQTVPLVLGQTTYSITEVVKVPQVVLLFTNGATQYELIEKSLYDFNQLPSGTGNTGTPVHYYFQPGLANGTLGIWPAPDAGTVANNSLRVVKQKKFDGFFSAGETPDFPSYFTDALIYTLAVRLAPEYGVPLQDRQALRSEADEYTKAAFDYGDEDGSLYLQPDMFMWRN